MFLFCLVKYSQILFNYFEPQDIDSGMVSLLVSSVVDRGLGPQSCQTKDNLIGICCFSVKHITLRSKC